MSLPLFRLHHYLLSALVIFSIPACSIFDTENERPKRNFDSEKAIIVGTLHVPPLPPTAETANSSKNEVKTLATPTASFFIRTPNGAGESIHSSIFKGTSLESKNPEPQPFALTVSPGKYKIISWSVDDRQNSQSSLLPKREISFDVKPGKIIYIGRFTVSQQLKMSSIEDKYSEDVASIKTLISSLIYNHEYNSNTFFSNSLKNSFLSEKFSSNTEALKNAASTSSLDDSGATLKNLLYKPISINTTKLEGDDTHANEQNSSPKTLGFETGKNLKNTSDNFFAINSITIDNNSIIYLSWLLPTAKNFNNGITEITANNIIVTSAVAPIQPLPPTEIIANKTPSTPLADPSPLLTNSRPQPKESLPAMPQKKIATKTIKPQTTTQATRYTQNNQLARDSDAKKIIEMELKKAKNRHDELIKEFNSGQPERFAIEFSNDKQYQDRIVEIKTSISRVTADIDSLQRELKNLQAQTR
jgi:hypothetical protein